jgi:hypothetical protein
MFKFQIAFICLVLFFSEACQKQDVTVLDGTYKGFYALDTFQRVPTELVFERGRIKFKRFNISNGGGSFSISDSTLSITQTQEEFCASNCDCNPLANCVYNPISNTSFFTFNITDDSLKLLGASRLGYGIVIFNLKKN